MQLDELKRNMSVLEQVLAKASADIEINLSASEPAQKKILRKYRKSFTNSLILAAVFSCLLMGNVSPEKLPNFYKLFIVILSLLAAGWYIFLFMRLKKINIARLSPTKLFSEMTTIKILTLSGEVLFGLVLTVFFTLLLSYMLDNNTLAFRLTVGFLIFALAGSVLYAWPRYIKLFGDLTTIKE